MKLLTTPPVALLLASIERVLREGIPQIPALTPATPWPSGTACPEGHPFFPAGLRIYDYMQPGRIVTPSCELLCDDKAVEKVERDDCIWNIPVEVDLLWDRDIWDGPDGEQLQVVIKMILTNAVTLPDTSIQTAQARLSTPLLHVWGARDAENFTNQSFDKLTASEGHPFMAFGFTVTCSGRFAGEVPNLTVDTALPAALYTDVLDRFTFLQTTAGISITLDSPTDGSRKVITLRNDGTASFILGPFGMTGGVTVPAGSGDALLHWDVGVAAWAPGI